MSQRSNFPQYFPLVVDSLVYGIYSVLFYQSVQVLLSRRTPNYKLHLGWMTTLFLLSTIHIALAYAWAFITDNRRHRDIRAVLLEESAACALPPRRPPLRPPHRNPSENQV
ncbi:hypothetical protein B0H14DRAFT_1403096 [Mycena olivaceomarginata]|nr:hypothetical protein B0H14DRAFT_1403096 [Mycena olivaceomarginata]